MPCALVNVETRPRSSKTTPTSAPAALKSKLTRPTPNSAAKNASAAPSFAGGVSSPTAYPNIPSIFLDGLKLTLRQWQIAQLLGQGQSTKQIAGDLKLSPKTVEYHRMHIYFALGCSSPVELTHWLLRRNLIPLLDP